MSSQTPLHYYFTFHTHFDKTKLKFDLVISYRSKLEMEKIQAMLNILVATNATLTSEMDKIDAV